jgi:hypothetical protein
MARWGLPTLLLFKHFIKQTLKTIPTRTALEKQKSIVQRNVNDTFVMKILLLHGSCAYPVPDGTKFKMCVTRFVDQKLLVELHKKFHVLV